MSSNRTDSEAGRTARLTDVSRAVNSGDYVPRDAATLMLIDRSGPRPRLLVGKRHAGHAFMPGMYVFPGGRVEACDFDAPAAGELHDEVARKLGAQIRPEAHMTPRAIALAAIRETFEECGILLGAPGQAPAPARTAATGMPDTWSRFHEAGFLPDLSAIRFIGRAIAPPGVRHRFDARFLALDIAAITRDIAARQPLEDELVETLWVSPAQARGLNMPTITGIMLEELQDRLSRGFGPDLPVPFFHMQDGAFVRDTL